MPTDEFLQLRLFRSSQALRNLLYAERELISRFDLPAILQLAEKKAVCIADLEYLSNKITEDERGCSLINQDLQGRNHSANQPSRTSIYIHQGSLVLQIQILDLLRGTQSLIEAALERIEKTRLSLSVSGPHQPGQMLDWSTDHLGLLAYLESEETLLRQIYESNQHLMDVSEALQKRLCITEKSA